MNLPNKITMLRILLIPVFVYVYLTSPFGETVSLWVALWIFVFAAITDAIDGYLARKYKLVTNFGKLMDPLADKLLVTSAFIVFTATGELHVVASLLLIGREFYVTGLRVVLLEQGVVLPAGLSGKIKTISQITLVIYYLQPISLFHFDFLVTGLIIFAVFISLYSACEYTIKNRNIFLKGD